MILRAVRTKPHGTRRHEATPRERHAETETRGRERTSGRRPWHETGRCANASKETRGRMPGHRPWDTPFSQAPTAATETDTHGGHQTGKAKDPGHAFGW